MVCVPRFPEAMRHLNEGRASGKVVITLGK